MKKIYCHKCIVFLLLLYFGFSISLKAQGDTLYIGSNFSTVNLKPFSEVNKGSQNQIVDERSYYYFSFNKTINTIDFTLKNKVDVPKKVILELSNAFIKEIVFGKVENNIFIPIATTGIEHPISTKPLENRLFSFPISLNANETASFQLKLKKEGGKPLVTTACIKSENTFVKQSFVQQIIIGSYFGVSVLSVIFSLFIFYFLRQSIYLIYAAYVISLGLFISSYIGVFSQLFLTENDFVNKYTHYVLFSEISLLLFALLSQKILEAETYMPKLKRGIDVLLTVLIALRLLLHFVFTKVFESAVSVFMNIWYAIFLILIIIIVIEITIYFRKNNKRTSFFALAYLFMIIGTLASILYHSYGLVNTYVYDLPLLFYSSFLEILFLTFTVVLMVKDIYDERNILSEKIVIEEKKNLTAFIKGEDQERKRISKELHDNIGSQLSYLKRFVSDKFKDEDVTETIDSICNDVRNLSHDISPSDLKIVGFKNAVEDLSQNISSQTTLNVDFSRYHFPETLDDDIATQLYRVVQEAFNNILKHANAKHIDLQLMGHQDSITISIEDDGDGFDTKHKKSGIGLKNMQSRIHQIGGTLSIDSQINRGTSLLITLPI
ncbi:7TM diverse intracellular signaling domain-containing protein [Algibacter sp. 2305UL17-15]|uniref:sensor histidine kinase n=1 Tax=Algibacter sp. 2305UL17-15 TaxID=3231268 RepID=UPI0034596F6E